MTHLFHNQSDRQQANHQLGLGNNIRICSLVLMISAFLVGCNDTSNTINHDNPSDSALAKEAQIHETVKVGTDLDIERLKAIGDAFHAKTGVTVQWMPLDPHKFDIESEEDIPVNPDIELPDGLDMLLMHSAYTVNNAKNLHELQPLGSDILDDNVPDEYSDSDGFWYGLSYYARTLVYNQNNVNKPELMNYAGLAEPKWQGRLCMTADSNSENQAILKRMLEYRGTTNTAKILAGWQHNRFQPSSDDAQILAQIEQGQCDVGVVDSDVFWQYAKSNPATNVRLMWTNQINRGALTNSITAGVLKESENSGYALRLMEWLADDEGQALLAYSTSTFPIRDLQNNPKINWQAIRPDWTQFDEEPVSLNDIMEDNNQIEPFKEASEDRGAENS